MVSCRGEGGEADKLPAQDPIIVDSQEPAGALTEDQAALDDGHPRLDDLRTPPDQPPLQQHVQQVLQQLRELRRQGEGSGV